jgi:bacillolysin
MQQGFVLAGFCLAFLTPQQAAGLSPQVPEPNANRPTLQRESLVDLARALQNELGVKAGAGKGAKTAGQGAAKAISGASPLIAYTNGQTLKLDADNPDWQIRWNNRNGTLTSIDDLGPIPSGKIAPGIDPAAWALEQITHRKTLFRLQDPTSELRLADQLEGPLGRHHVRFQQYYQDLPVWGHELTVHLDARGLYALNARYAPTPNTLASIKPRLTEPQAIDAALDHLATRQPIEQLTPQLNALLQYTGPKADLCIWIKEDTQTPYLAWHITVRPNWRDRWAYFIDAHTGEVLEHYNNTHTQEAVTARATDLNGVEQTLQVLEADGTFFMIDASRPIFQANQPNIITNPQGAILTLDLRNRDLGRNPDLSHVTSTNNVWNDPVAVSAHSNTGRVFEYFFNVHGRRGIDDRNGTMVALIHVTQDGLPLDNAFWNGRFMAYGDGRRTFRPLAGSLDVAGHEMTHGVIERTVNLEYRFESGALNESLADVFGTMVDRDDWQLGEDIAESSFFPSGALRDMSDPHNGGSSRDPFWQPAHMDELRQLSINQDNGGVHVNSGIPNRACFLIGDAIGREKTEQIYYRILDARYLNSRSNFIDMRQAVRRAAVEFFGEASAEVEAVENAFNTVGIIGAEGLETPEDIAPVEGDPWVAVVNAEPNDQSLFLARPTVDSADDIRRLTTTQVYTLGGNPITVSADGSLILFIDADNFIRRINSDGSDERVISNEGAWNSIALSPDRSKLAANTIGQDSTIFIFDRLNPDEPKTIRLYSPTTQEGVRAFIVRYADVMAWDSQGRFLVYDAFNTVAQDDNLNIAYWDMHVLDVENEIIFPLFQALPEGISMGNPSFAQTSDNIIAFDLKDANTNRTEIWAANLFTGQSSRIEANGDSSAFGTPHFSPDDRFLVFQRPANRVATLRQIPLAASHIQTTGPSQPYLTEGQRPTWFTIVQRPTAVETTNNTEPSSFQLAQNHPNPFNPSTTIRYSVKRATNMRLNIYDLRGALVRKLETGFKSAGAYTVEWDGRDVAGRQAASGVYIYQLETDAPSRQRLSRKMVLLR